MRQIFPNHTHLSTLPMYRSIFRDKYCGRRILSCMKGKMCLFSSLTPFLGQCCMSICCFIVVWMSPCLPESFWGTQLAQCRIGSGGSMGGKCRVEQLIYFCFLILVFPLLQNATLKDDPWGPFLLYSMPVFWGVIKGVVNLDPEKSCNRKHPVVQMGWSRKWALSWGSHCVRHPGCDTLNS